MIDLPILALFTFVKLNDDGEVRSIYLDDVLLLNEILKQEAERLNKKYNSTINYDYYRQICYNPTKCLICYEDEHGFVIKLPNGLDLSEIYIFLKQQYNDLFLLTQDIDFNYLFLQNKKQLLR